MTGRATAGGSGPGAVTQRKSQRKSRRFSLLFLSTFLGTIVAGGYTTALAQEARETLSFNIPAQPLASALATFMRASEWDVSFTSDAVSGKRSTVVTGLMSPEQALRTLLAGTGVIVRMAGARTAALVVASSNGNDASSGDTTTLQPIVVAVQGSTTEGTGSYTTGEMSTATGLDLSIRETPQSVSVVSSARMRDNGMTTVEDALSKTTGITVLATGGERSNYFSRGFQVDNIMMDGVPIAHDSDTLGSASLAMYDRIEVVRGATGLLEGAGNPSASINLVRKRPTDTRQISVTGSAGSWADYMGILDAGGSLNADGSLRGRFVTSLQDANTYTQDYEHKRQLYYGVLEADITDNTM
ncbi:TonB-dependent receptor, partial [Ensifer adhaerens]